MVSKQKIIVMTRLALYDKHDGLSDRVANDYFRHDYIYKKNLGTRIAVGLGSALILGLYWLRVIVIDEVDIFELNIEQLLTDSIIFVMAVLAVYSLIGTIQGTREYYLVQKRLDKYQQYTRYLERAEGRGRKAATPPDERQAEKRRRERRARERIRDERVRESTRESFRDVPVRETIRDRNQDRSYERIREERRRARYDEPRLDSLAPPPITRDVNESRLVRKDPNQNYGAGTDSTRGSR